MKITIKNVFIEIYHFINQIKQYYELFCRAYLIIESKIFDIDFVSAFQMTFKTINDSIKSHELISILSVFDASFCMIETNAFSFIII